MSVRPVSTADTFCTIMSMLISVPATASKIRAASPTRSGTPTMVILASPRSCATPEMIACSIWLPSSSSSTQVPSLSENDDRTCTLTFSRLAYSTHRRCRIFAPQAAISSISSYEIRGIRRALGTIRGSAVNTPSTSV